MNTYPKYKDSGEQWLGQIPEHWEILPGMAVFEENKEKNKQGTENTVLSLSYGKIIVKEKKDEGLVPAEYTSYQIVHPNYIIIRCTDLQNDKVSFRTGLVRNDGIITSAYLGLIVKGNNPQYIHYYLHALDITKEIYRYGSGLRQSLSWSDFKRLNILVPPLDEQEAMVAYLDEQTAQIDSAIAREQKMIDLLEERKQIIIQQAVTKGLNPNAPMKDSGIEWIGEIPEGWKRTSLKRVCAIKTGKTPSTTRPAYFEDGTVNWYTPGDLNEFILVDSERKVTNLAAKEQACQVYPECSVYLVGIGGTIGKVAYSEVSASCNQQINVIIPDKESLDYKFLAYYLRTAKTEIYRGANLSTLPIINQDRTGALPIICPPIEEQKAIVVFIAKAADPIDKAIAAKNRVITLLQERKQIIINEVVTGKIKVS